MAAALAPSAWPSTLDQAAARDRSLARDQWSFYLLIGLAVVAGTGSGLVNFAQNRHLNLTVFVSDGRSAIAVLVGTLSLAGTILAAAYVMIAHLSRAPRRSPLVLLVVAPWAYQIISALGFGSVDSRWVSDILLVALAAVALWLADSDVLLRGVAAFSLLPIVGSLLLGLLTPANAMYPNEAGVIGTDAKSLVGGELLAGAFGHPNTLGLYAALCLPLQWGARTWWSRLGAFASLVALVWSGSRTSMLAVGAAAAALAVQWLVRRSRSAVGRTEASSGVFVVAALAMVVVIVALPFTVVDPDAYTGRGGIWQEALGAAGRSLWLGGGRGWFEDHMLLTSGLNSQANSGHNLFVDILVTGGVVDLLLIAALVAALIVSAGRIEGSLRLPAQWFVLTLLGVSVFEYIWPMGIGNELFVPVVGGSLIVLGSIGRRRPAAAPRAIALESGATR